MEGLATIKTENVNLHSAVRVLCRHTDDIVARAKSLHGLPNTAKSSTIEHIENVNVFLTGFTGDVGAFLVRELLNRNNTVYCLVRPSIEPVISAKERFIERCNRLVISDYYKNNKIHFIGGDYSQKRLGINDRDWIFLSQNINVIISSGCRVNLTMSWSQGVNGILRPTNTLIELALTKQCKPLFVIGSSGSRLALFGTPGEEFCRGYQMAKFVDLERLKYYHYTTHHPVKVLVIGYIDRHQIGPPTFRQTFHSFFWTSFKLNIFPMIDGPIDYANAAIVAKKALDSISFKTNKLIYGAYAEKKDHLHLMAAFKMMKQMQPSIKLVSVEEFRAAIRQMDKMWGTNYRPLLNADAIYSSKDLNLMMYAPPSNNIDFIQGPDKNMMFKILTYIKNASFQEFTTKINPSPYFGYPWWNDVDVPLKSKL